MKSRKEAGRRTCYNNPRLTLAVTINPVHTSDSICTLPGQSNPLGPKDLQ